MKNKILILLGMFLFSFAFISAGYTLETGFENNVRSPLTTGSSGCDGGQTTYSGLEADIVQDFSVTNISIGYDDGELVYPSTGYIWAYYENGTASMLASSSFDDIGGYGKTAYFDYVNVTTDMSRVLFVWGGESFTNCWVWMDATHPVGNTDYFSVTYPVGMEYPTPSTVYEMTDDGYPEIDTSGYIYAIGIVPLTYFSDYVPPTSGGILHFDNLIEDQEEETPAPITGDVVVEPKPKFSFLIFLNNLWKIIKNFLN